MSLAINAVSFCGGAAVTPPHGSERERFEHGGARGGGGEKLDGDGGEGGEGGVGAVGDAAGHGGVDDSVGGDVGVEVGLVLDEVGVASSRYTTVAKEKMETIHARPIIKTGR